MLISGAVYELNQSYDQVFIVIGGVYLVDALVFGAAALLQSQRRRSSTSLTSPDVDCSRCGTGFQLSSDVGQSAFDTVPDVAVSNYGTVVAVKPVDADGRVDDGIRRDQTATTWSSPSSVDAEWLQMPQRTCSIIAYHERQARSRCFVVTSCCVANCVAQSAAATDKPVKLTEAAIVMLSAFQELTAFLGRISHRPR